MSHRLGIGTFDDIIAVGTTRALLFDLAAAWTARRFANGEAHTLPDDPPTDSRGLPQRIVF